MARDIRSRLARGDVRAPAPAAAVGSHEQQAGQRHLEGPKCRDQASRRAGRGRGRGRPQRVGAWRLHGVHTGGRPQALGTPPRRASGLTDRVA